MKNFIMTGTGIIYGMGIRHPKIILGFTIILHYLGVISNEIAIVLYMIAILGIYEILIYLKMDEVADEKATNNSEEIDVFNKYFKYTIVNIMAKIFKENQIKILCRNSFLNNRKED